MKNKSVRLSKNVIPIFYDIQMKPDLENFTFEGIETIELSILKPTKTLTLHSKEIEIDTARLGNDFAQKISYDEKNETASFTFLKTIPKSKAKLIIVFKGILNDKMRGFYKSSYEIDGKTHHIATTQFEATDARRAFPCFDEPAHKAVFHVSLIIPKGKTAISNTLPVSVAEHESGFEIVKFSPTPKMSTYLLAFVVGDFEHIKGKTNNGTEVRVFTTAGKSSQASFSLNCAIKTLEFYEKYFDIAYPLPVLDMIAIPDFASLAMENWGAITYREIGLLVDEQHTSLGNKQMIALVIAHEIAHQWFGNLVTMEWWTHLWLNEGFASYIEYLAIDELFPKWEIWTQFATYEQGIALRLDSLFNTHPIEIPVHHPDEIGEIFDEVSYSKGASVIRMLADYLGEKDFRDGLRYYLKKHSYKNTETVHLWQAFEKISKKPVAGMMQNWTGHGGYPVIEASLNKNNLILEQSRFFLSSTSKKKAKDKTLWQIPVSISKHGEVEKLFLNRLSQSIKTSDSYIKINAGESGFYRTAYTKELLEKLYIPVSEKKIETLDRLGIIRDLFALSEAGVIATTNALEFLTAFKNEDSYIILLEIAGGLSRIDQLLSKTASKETKGKLNQLIISLFTPSFQKLGWGKEKNEPFANTLLRSLTIVRLGRSGDNKIISEAKKRFAKLTRGTMIDPNLRSAIYSIIAHDGGLKEYNTVIKLYKKETLHEEKNRLGGVLGDFKDPKILKMVCDFAMSKNVRTQDTVSIISSIAMNPYGRDIWWSFITKNWKTLVSRYGDGGHTLGRLIKAFSGSPEKKHFLAFKKFFQTHDAPGAKRSIEQVLERLENNTLWLARDGKKIEKFLQNIEL